MSDEQTLEAVIHRYAIDIKAFDASGNVVTIGAFGGTVDFAPGSDTFKLSSLSPTDLFILTLDTSGNFISATATEADWGDITTDASGNFYVCGSFLGTVDFDPGPGVFNLTCFVFDSTSTSTKAFILKLDASCNFMWAVALGGDDGAGGCTITSNSSGSLWVAGGFSGVGDFDPGPGTTNLTAELSWGDLFTVKLSSTLGEPELLASQGLIGYPNPTSGKISFTVEDKTLTSLKLRVSNIQGQLILERELKAQSKFEVDLSNKPSGMYFISVESPKGSYHVKAIKN